jgi:hypothetical protein
MFCLIHKIVGECIEEIICNDVTLGNITIVTITGSGSSYMEVKSRALNTQGQLPLIVSQRRKPKF